MLKRHLFACVAMLIFSSAGAQVQSEWYQTYKGAPERDKFNELYQFTGELPVPPQVVQQLKDYAALNNLSEASVLKEGRAIAFLFDERIPVAKRLEVIPFIEKLYDKPNPGLPPMLIQKTKTDLQKRIHPSSN